MNALELNKIGSYILPSCLVEELLYYYIKINFKDYTNLWSSYKTMFLKNLIKTIVRGVIKKYQD